MPMNFFARKVQNGRHWLQKSLLNYFTGNLFFITFAVRKKDHYGQSMSGYRKKTHHREYCFAFEY